MSSAFDPSAQPQASSDGRLKVADLIDRPGVSRRLDERVSMPEGLTLPLAQVREPLHLVGVLESVVDGILARGELGAVLDLECARCLEPVTADVRAEVVELYTDPTRVSADVAEPEQGYEIVDDQIDLDALLRDTLAPAVPVQPLCDAACEGICATCGTNRNEASCSCTDDADDPRWAVLAELDLPDER